MPVLGVRIPVKLPWKGATNNTEQFVSMKAPVAKKLGFSSAKKTELEYKVEVQKKDKADGTKVSGKVTVTRRRRPGYRQRSVKLVFQAGHKGTPGGARSNTLVGKPITIDSKQYKSIQFPITTSVAIAEVVEYFESGNGKNLNVLKVVDVNTGQGYNLIQ